MKATFLRCASAVFLLASVGFGQFVAAPATGPSPSNNGTVPYTLLRYNEDYSYLRDSSRRTDLWDPIKYVPLNADGDWYATFGGQVRERYEFFNHAAFGAGVQDKDGYVLSRLMYNADIHLGPNIRGFVQGITALENGREGGPRAIVDVNTVDLYQGFLDLRVPIADRSAVTFRAGRESLSFGKERLIGTADWPNTRRTFDGFHAILNSPGNQLDAFFVRPVVIDKYEFDNDQGHTLFGGVYDTLQLPDLPPRANSRVELYALDLDVNTIARWPSKAGTGSENRYTLGTHLSTNPKPFDADLEADYQFGNFATHQIHAYSIATEAGYTASFVRPSPRLFVGFDIASGDHHPGSDGLGTFNQLFPSGHPYFGYIDVIGRQNIIDLHPGIDTLLLEHQPGVEKLTYRVEYHEFWRQSNTDAVYNVLGGVLRSSATNRSTWVGSEIDTLLTWQIDRHLGAYGGYSHFFSGNFITQTGAHRGIDFFYAALVYTF